VLGHCGLGKAKGAAQFAHAHIAAVLEHLDDFDAAWVGQRLHNVEEFLHRHISM
jgi:peptidyl-tRNA hydrolase